MLIAINNMRSLNLNLEQKDGQQTVEIAQLYIILSVISSDMLLLILTVMVVIGVQRL